MSLAIHWIAYISFIAVVPCVGRAQEAPATMAQPAATQQQQQQEARPTGLPAQVTWKFNFDAGWGSFGFANSLFNNPKEPGVTENLSDQWFEGYIKPALSGSIRLSSSSEFYGTLSAVGERTYGSVPSAFGEDVSSFQAEDLSVGWRSGTSLERLGENALDFTVGRTQYHLGHGFLLLRRRGRRRKPRRLLDERAQGVRVRGDRPHQAGRIT